MSFTLNFTNDIVKATNKVFDEHRKQIRFATNQTINQVGKRTLKTIKIKAKREIDRPIPFTMSGFRFKESQISKLLGRIFVMPIQWEYIQHIVEPNVRKAKKKYIGIPVEGNVALNKYGNAIGKSKGLVKNKKTMFVGRRKGVLGVWQRGRIATSGKNVGNFSTSVRKGDKTLRLLWDFEKTVKYKRTFFYYQHAEKSITRHFIKDFRLQLTRAIRNSK